MAQSGGTEKELVLGNKQLLGVFFVGTALCAVFFAMGYMVGRNSAKTATLTPADSSTAAPLPGESARRQQPEPPRETAADPLAQQTTPTETRPVQESPVSVTAPAPEPPKATVSAEPKAAASSAVITPETGASYLQVAALPRADAENMLHSLREQNLPAILASSPKEGYIRVLVGPYHQTAQLAEAKSRLKTLGFANAYVQRQ